MFELAAYKIGKVFATPDRVEVPEFGYSFRHFEEDGITWTYDGSSLYVSGFLIHSELRKAYRITPNTPIFEGRIFKKLNLMTFWWDDCLGDLGYLMGEVVSNLSGGKFFCPDNERVEFGNVDYSFIFPGIVDGVENIIMCDFDGLVGGGFEPVQTYGMKYGRSMYVTKRSAYSESCLYWSKRAWGIDVAEYHLLAYEE